MLTERSDSYYPYSQRSSWRLLQGSSGSPFVRCGKWAMVALPLRRLCPSVSPALVVLYSQSPSPTRRKPSYLSSSSSTTASSLACCSRRTQRVCSQTQTVTRHESDRPSTIDLPFAGSVSIRNTTPNRLRHATMASFTDTLPRARRHIRLRRHY